MKVTAPVIAAIIALAVIFLFAWLVVALAIEITVLVVVVVAGLFGRVVLRRPWTVVAVNEHDERRIWEVVGWRASRTMIRDIGAALGTGMPLPAQTANRLA
jgi:hypothetical protein